MALAHLEYERACLHAFETGSELGWIEEARVLPPPQETLLTKVSCMSPMRLWRVWKTTPG